jgi:hypothetical protein
VLRGFFMSAAPEYDFEMQAGDTKRLIVSVKDPAGAAIPLGGAISIQWWAAKKVTSAIHLVEKGLGTGVTITDAPNGVLRVDIDPDDTALISGAYYHELEVIDSAGDIQTVLKGTMTVVKSLIVNP